MKRKYLILSLLTIFCLASCSRTHEIVYQDGQGGLEFSISSQLTDTKADARDANINIDDFKIELYNAAGVKIRSWSKYSAYKQLEDKVVLINADSQYTLRALYGDSTAVGFDAFFFMGDTTFTVDPQTTKTIDVVCKQANAEVAVVYDNVIKTEYSDYHATVKHVRTKDSLVFGKDAAESGYIRTGALNLYLYLTDLEGVSKRYGTKTPVIASPGDSVTFNVKAVPTPTMEMKFEITINSTTTDYTETVSIGAYMLSKDAPVITPDGFDMNTGIVSCIEGVVPTAAALNIKAASGIGACTMTVNSSHLKSKGWPDVIDFFNISPEIKTVLERDGLLWSEHMDGLTLANIDFKNVAKTIEYTTDEDRDNMFTVKVVDKSDYKKEISATYNIFVSKAQVAMNAIAPADVWSQSLTATFTTDGNPEILYPVVKEDGGSWITPVYTSSVSGTANTFTITDLTAGKNYLIRGAYNNSRTSDGSFTTEAKVQVGNAGFENFYKTETLYSFKWGLWTYDNYTRLVFYPYNEGDSDTWWSTNNSATTSGATTPYYEFAKCFPTVNYTEASHSGTKAAQIRSVSVHSLNDAVTTKGGKTQGKFYCDGHLFPSRPTKMEFYYRYEAYNSDTYSVSVEIRSGDTTIATGSFTKKGIVSDWTLASVDLNYTDITKKATSIYITFLSSTNTSPDVDIKTVTILGKDYGTTHTGSCLTIDDINLVYGK